MKKLLCLGLILLISQLAFAHDASTYSDNKKAIMLDAKQPEFILKLAGNPSTGYSWFLKNSMDARFIKPLSVEYIPSTDKESVGAGGYWLWHFKVKRFAFRAPYTLSLQMTYARAWERTGDVTTFTVRTTQNTKDTAN